ncbi:hypothetical protein A2V49_02720 [candidate division WWE3 bacterium RBG_19FT_COMBO_34_6]|uniref:AI-2E family transporter n=1 Tax=candidate division WWE3 bacterium RBG_19FT_COMBO_34_6 TaxID=1802612 RepID=A0A1F4UQF6_UNCKA|nr:MAG: hypothetical protein A2V49_02720 [candidate division WWE3 bacterium RBG_19FT_COMBO_34_6]
MDKNIVISIKTILFTILIGLGLYVIYRLGSIIGVVLIAMLITISLERTIKFFSKQTFMNRRINRSMSVLITYLIAFLVITLAISIGLDPVITQSQKLIQTLSRNKAVLNLGENVDISLSDVVSGFVTTSGGVVSATRSIFGNVATLFSILILAIYMSIDWENIKKGFITLFPETTRYKLTKMFAEIEDNVGIWLRGQLILMLLIGVMSYVAVVLIDVEFPLALGIIAGLLEIVPMLGPVISAVVAALVAVIESPVKALLVIFAFTIIQQLEGNIIVPKVMQRVSGFSPIIILIALLVGSNLFGIIGAVIAVPVLMVGAIIIKNILE